MPVAKKRRTRGPPRHPLGVLPKGNLLYAPTKNIRAQGLGNLHVLDDTLLLELLASLPLQALLRISACSKAFFAFSRHEPLWKDIYLQHAGGVLQCWHGNWRKTFFAQSSKSSNIDNINLTKDISSKGLFSDVLFQPSLCAQADVEEFFLPSGSRSRSNISRRKASDITPESFRSSFASTSSPVIVTDALTSWPSYSSSLWTPDALRAKYKNIHFRAEALDCTLHTYLEYAANCAEDDSPLYLFDSRFVEKTDGVMAKEYAIPPYFNEDLFDLMGEERPDFRWLIVGPARSGSTFHKDPNHTSAWNAVLSGRKGWVMFPPNVLPPGVYVTPDEAEVTSPLSISEWFLSYFDEAWQTYGPDAPDPSLRNKMKVGICGPGEITFVPSGWWHLVVNLDFAVAVTQNYVSTFEIGRVLTFMRNKPDQVSGFKKLATVGQQCCDSDSKSLGLSLFERFCDALRQGAPTALEKGMSELQSARSSGAPSLWNAIRQDSILKDEVASEDNRTEQPTGFSFNFEITGDDE